MVKFDSATAPPVLKPRMRMLMGTSRAPPAQQQRGGGGEKSREVAGKAQAQVGVKLSGQYSPPQHMCG